MLGIRFAGQKLKEFDTAYADRVSKDIGPVHETPIRQLLAAEPVAGLGVDGADTLLKKAIGAAAVTGVAATNIGYRYGLPAAGVTLAGKGLYDLSVQLGQDGNGELPM